MEEKLRSTNQIQDGKVSGKEKADKNEEEEEEEEEEEVGYEGDTVCENRKDHNEKIMENMTQTKTKKARWFSIC